MIDGILPVQFTCLSLFHNLSPSFLWSTSWPGTLHFILHAFLHPIIVFFSYSHINRVSTNLTKQISRRFQEGFQEKSRTCLHCFGLLCNVPNLPHLMEHVIMSSNKCSSLCYSTDYNISYIFNTALLNVQSHYRYPNNKKLMSYDQW